MHPQDPLSFFRLKPLRAARVSEISEATASSSAAPEDRANFHIGNPVQDERLMSAYLRMVLGVDIREEKLGMKDVEEILTLIGWDQQDRPKLEFLAQLIEKSVPYTPRGGFSRSDPSDLVKAFTTWLQNQYEPLSYDLGQSSGRREIILATGGVVETLRILFHALSSSLVKRPARIFFHHVDFRTDEQVFDGLTFEHLSLDEESLVAQMHAHFLRSPEIPSFLVMGRILGEQTRRALRLISVASPLFFIEANDAPNHVSLAREAGLIQRVLRILTPSIFNARFKNLATVFLAGNADILSVFESIHFQLKGTPSASEIELLAYLLDHGRDHGPRESSAMAIPMEPSIDGISLPGFSFKGLPLQAQRFEQRVNRFVHSFSLNLDKYVQQISERAETLGERIKGLRSVASFDRFAGMDTKTFLDELVDHVDSPEWQEELERSLLSAFLRHHPEYAIDHCLVVSGSSRTTLGLLGFHCCIREVIVPDLSWSYEHCFPRVQAVPLKRDLQLDIDALIEAVHQRIVSNPHWTREGAVVINNPHNATGRVFQEDDVRRLLIWLLEHEVFIIDDLSYQDVAPSAELPRFKTVKQLSQELVREGRLSSTQIGRVITIHSVSKTDCLAGARLAVVELRNEELAERFADVHRHIRPNLGAIALTYLFYRNEVEVSRAYWRLRNQVFLDRTQALVEATRVLPKERNPFQIKIVPPTGSMYPLMIIEELPAGLSLDWLASGLARQGIGLLPLSTFAHTEEGFETGRNAFRLTLGGTDGPEALLKKTRRVLIDLNRLIAEESSRYNRVRIPAIATRYLGTDEERHARERWKLVEESIVRECMNPGLRPPRDFNDPDLLRRFREEYLLQRLAVFRQRYEDRSLVVAELTQTARADDGKSLLRRLELELKKDSLARRIEAFRKRSYDRTVHPTQMYSLKVESCFNEIVESLIRHEDFSKSLVSTAARELLREFLGLNVAITSSDESDELILDLDARIAAEMYAMLSGEPDDLPLLSFWGDWDGSNRPSGQGHRLVATTLIANVNRLSRLLGLLLRASRTIKVDSTILGELRELPENNRRFTRLLNDITDLTHQLEKRYRGVLPFNVRPTPLRKLGMKLHLARDPLTLLWHHNDRLERRMLDLRRRRRETLEYYFSLNKQLRKQLLALLPKLQQHLDKSELLVEACLYRDFLKRMVITPRIHQSLITAQDPFAIDTTVHNIQEINEISARYGNPGMILAVQVSMSTKPEALISLDRKLRARGEQTLRVHPQLELPPIQIIPLFEDLEAVRSIPSYLAKIWDHALESRRVNQDTAHRFAEIISEVFIAGSDLSQQIGQAAGAVAYSQAKRDLMLWLAERRLVDRVRIKLGSGEPMQRQGGYYSSISGEPAFNKSADARRLVRSHVHAAARKSTEYATTPLMGVFTGGDLRTLQSTIAEQLRFLPLQEAADVYHHLRISQRRHHDDLIRAAESLVESRLLLKKRGEQELARLTVGPQDEVFDRFIPILTEDFRQILYGREEDVVGVYVISYFIARTMPQLRDRPTVRSSAGTGSERGQRILEQIAQTIPLARHGSRLRAIAHNQAQTVVLGLNQLTTGLFRALDRFTQLEFKEGDARTLIADRVLPRLPVYEMLHTLRIYHDADLTFLKRLEPAFPAGNSAFLALREDNDSLRKFVVPIQQELVRRHGLEPNDFFENGSFVPRLLPALRPDLAVLLQRDIFNTKIDGLLDGAGGPTERQWRNDVERLLALPEMIRSWRSKIWDMLEQPIFKRVQSFVELAVALNSLSSTEPVKHPLRSLHELKIPSDLSRFFRAASIDDDMREFLAAAFDYLTTLSEGMIEVPVAIIRCLKEVEEIARIEEQALPPEKQELLRFYMLQIARLAGENG